jgi:[ribosomal protein S18]-alanine N-acetyltransferase
MIRLRKMNDGDLEWVLRLDRETEAAPHWPQETYWTFLEAGEPGDALRRFALVAEADDERAGVALGRLLLDGVENVCELEWIAVEAGMRRRGIGRALMEGVEAWSRDHGGHRLMLEVRAGNDTAQRLYGSSGWMEAGRRRSYYKDPVEDAVLMERVSSGGGKACVEWH